MVLTADKVLDALRPIEDPDLHRSIVDLGFIKNLAIEGKKVRFDLELTTPACPVKDQLKAACVEAVQALDGGTEVEVELTAQTRGPAMPKGQGIEGVKNIVAIASGKGGVAKSTTAVNVAVALRDAGAKVGILDADVYGPSLPTMLTIEKQPDVEQDQRLVPAIANGMKMISMGFFVPPGKAAILRGPMVSGYINQLLTNTDWGELDYLVIDYPPGTGDVQLTLSQQAPITGAVICTTPQYISLIDAHKAVALFDTTKIPVIGVIETMSYFICDGCNKRHDIFRSGGGVRVAEAAGVPFLGQVPIDAAVAAGGDEGKPIVESRPDSAVAKAYVDVAGALASQLSILNHERGSYLETFSLKWDQSE